MIDLPSFFQSSVKAMQSQRQTELESLAQRINLKVGQTTTALIERVTPVNTQLAERISQLQSSQHSSAAKTLINSQWLSQPNIKLLELNIQGQTLLTLSDQPAKPNQTVQLLLKSAAQLVLVPSSKNDSTQQPSNAAALNALSQSYRQALPRQAPLQQTFRLLEALQQLPSLQQQQLPTSLQQSLKQLQQHQYTPQQLAHSQGLKTALQRSGVQLEATLQQHRQQQLSQQAGSNTTTLKPTDSTLATLSGNTTATASKPEGTLSLSQPLAAMDTKAALLQLEQRLNQYLTQARSVQGNSVGTLALPVNANVDTLVTLLKSFMASTSAQSTTTDSSQREAVLQSLQQQLQSAVAKMQTQQLHTLSQQLAKPDQPQAQHWNIELPVRLNNDISSVEVRIDEDWVTPKQDEEDQEESKDKIRLWTVMLAFDLPEHGKLFAQLKIIQDSVSANLWAEQASTLAEAKRKLQTLRQRLDDDGVNVTSIECFKGRPPQQDIRLDYALVDVKT